MNLRIIVREGSAGVRYTVAQRPQRGGAPGYRAAIERALPGTIPQLVEKSGMREPVVRQWIKRFRGDGTCHIGDWERERRGRGACAVLPVFVPGPGADEPYIPDVGEVQWLDLPRNRNRQLVLDAMPGSKSEIAAKTGLSKGVVGRWVDELHSEGKCRIWKWRRPEAVRGPHMPIYKAGEGEDKPKNIEYLTEAEKSVRYREKQARLARQEEVHRDRSQRRVLVTKAKQLGMRRDPMIAALHGAAKRKGKA